MTAFKATQNGSSVIFRLVLFYNALDLWGREIWAYPQTVLNDINAWKAKKMPIVPYY